MRFMLAHFDEFKSTPSPELVKAKIGIASFEPPNIDETFDPAWFLTEIEKFCRFKAIENIVLEGIDLLMKGDEQQIEARVKEALAISIDRNSNKRYTRMNLTDLHQRPMPEYLIPGLLFERQIAMIYGEPGSLKSFIVLSLASKLAHGMRWDNQRLDKRRVIYVAGEGAPMMGLRRLGWLQHHGLPREDDGLDVVPMPVDLTDDEAVATFIREMQQDDDNVGLVIFDTLSTCTAGKNENAPEVATAAIDSVKRIIEALNSAAIIVHHPGKDTSRGARGHSSLLGNVDTMWKVERSGMSATLKVEKQKDGETFKTYHFNAVIQETGILDRRGDERTTLVLTEGQPPLPGVAGESITREEADRITIAGLIPINTPLSLNQLVPFVGGATLLGKRAGAIERVKAAIPFDRPVRIRTDNEVVELSRVIGTNRSQLVEKKLITD